MKYRLTFLLAASLSMAACKKSVPPPIVQRDTLPPITTVLHVQTYITTGRDSTMPPRDTAHLFGTRDTIHGVIETQNAEDGTALLGRWYYLANGMKIAENSARLSAGTDLSHFDLINEQPWLPGDYKLLVLLNGVLRDSARFSIVQR